MKKILLNSTLFAALAAGAVSIWVLANPISAYAASAWATCLDGSTISCTAAGSNCEAEDSTSSKSGKCVCISQADGSTTALGFCMDGLGDPPLPD